MKDLSLLVWLTQLGLSVALPPVCFILLAVWLRDSCGWGGWVLWAGIGLGIYRFHQLHEDAETAHFRQEKGRAARIL